MPPAILRILCSLSGIAARAMFLFAVLVAVSFPSAVLAQATITITEGTVEPTPIAIAHFTDSDGRPSRDGRAIARIIADDLADSGMFFPEASVAQIKVAPHPERPDFADWVPLGVKAMLTGSAERVTTADGPTINVAYSLWDVSTQQEIASGNGAASPAGIRRISHQIADHVFKIWTGDDGYFDTRIVYVSESGRANNRRKRLAIMDHDGENHSYLTNGEWLVLNPRFSPLVQEIAYVDYFNNDPKVYLMNVSTGQAELLGEFPGMTFAPRFSFDGKKLIMSQARNGNTDIFEMEIATEKTRQLTTHKDIDTSPSYSPDGKRIAFQSDRCGRGCQQIYVMNANGRNVERISRGAGRYATPVWSPRGDLIAFTKIVDGDFYIGVMNTDGTGERTLTRATHVEAPTWSPNGRVLVYFKQDLLKDGAKTYLYRIDITGFNERRLKTPGQASDPAWSPRLPQ